jgi:hypothetical protein
MKTIITVFENGKVNKVRTLEVSLKERREMMCGEDDVFLWLKIGDKEYEVDKNELLKAIRVF